MNPGNQRLMFIWASVTFFSSWNLYFKQGMSILIITWKMITIVSFVFPAISWSFHGFEFLFVLTHFSFVFCISFLYFIFSFCILYFSFYFVFHLLHFVFCISSLVFCISLLYFEQGRRSKFMAQSAFDGQLAKRIASYLHEKRWCKKTTNKRVSSYLHKKRSKKGKN